MDALRDYQRIAVRRLKEALVAGKRPCLQAPTGSGKTLMAEALIKWAIDAGHRALFVCNRISLVDQAVTRFREYDPGVLQADNSRAVGNKLLVASIQTAMTRLTLREYLTSSALVVIDECHAVPGSKQYREFLTATPGRLCGLSATPWSKGLGKYFNELIVGATVPQLIGQGYLVGCHAFVPDRGPDLSDVPMVAGDFHEKKLAQTMNQPTLIGGIVEHWLKLARGMPTLLFAVDIAHSQNICQRFNEAGIHAEHIDHYTDLADRLAIFRRFKDGETKIICNVAVMAEGIDLPVAQCMVLARPTRSIIRHIQQAGRILRPFPGKTQALILDHSDTVTTLGMPTRDLVFPLNTGKEKISLAKMLKDKEHPDMTTCSACGIVKPVDQRRCENCGHTPQKKSDVQYVQGSLRLLKEKPVEIDIPTIRSIYRQILGYTKSKGKKNGYAFYRTKEYFANDPLVARALRSYNAPPDPPSDVILRWIISRNIRWAKRREKNERMAGPTTTNDRTMAAPPDGCGGGSEVAD